MAAQHRPFCNKALDFHVRFDRVGHGYRAVIRCRCATVCRTSKKLHDRCADAEAEARALWVAYVEGRNQLAARGAG